MADSKEITKIGGAYSSNSLAAALVNTPTDNQQQATTKTKKNERNTANQKIPPAKTHPTPVPTAKTHPTPVPTPLKKLAVG